MNWNFKSISTAILQEAGSRSSRQFAPVGLYLPMEYGSWIANSPVGDSDEPAEGYPALELYLSPGLTRGRVDASGI
ncbi:MAG TPA: hypothetical protein VHN81_04625 [Edaphobacter sp.]|nr:hypothetical protein [Edaphobacter sp.]